MEENHNKIEQQTTLKPIWNPKYFLILTLFFSHIPLSIFYILNYHRLNKKSLRNKSILITLIATILVVIGLSFITSEFIIKILSFAVSYGMGYYMMASQSQLYKEHIENGGRSAKYILPVLLSVCFLGALIWLIFLTINIPDQYTEFLDDEIYYTENVTVEDVNLLGNYLIDIEYFNEDNLTASVKLDYAKDIYKVYFVVIKEAIEDEDILQAFGELRYILMEDVFVDSDVEIHFADEFLNTLKIIKD